MVLLCSVLGTPSSAISYGGGKCGKLEGGVSLPCGGNNFESFSSTACLLGRNHVHPLVKDTVLEAYRILEKATPTRRWQYGETGKKNGGAFWPHKTHQNGLSVDFFVPVVNTSGSPVPLSITPFNRMGYGIEFDARGRFQNQRIDFVALGQHLLALHDAAQRFNVRLARIIVTPEFHAVLFEKVPDLGRLQDLFMKTEAWVRHDEHYHVDFELHSSLRRSLTCTE